MARKKPISNKMRKTQLQEKKAVKRGDILPPESSKPRPKRPQHGRPGGNHPTPMHENRIESARKLQSSFLKVSPSFLALSKQIASTEPLARPLPSDSRNVPVEVMGVSDDLECPKRPKWRFDMTKKEVELNEERSFTQWQEETQAKLNRWRGLTDNHGVVTPSSSSLKSPSYFERNLEVWRQLWRVTEISSILLVLLDSRCPPLHIPPSLYTFIKGLRPPRQIIFVLTKTGTVGKECATAWKKWVEMCYPDAQVVSTESYRRKQDDTERKGQGSRKRHEPHIPSSSLTSLVSALQTAHQALLTPPQHLRDNPEKLARWRPRVREIIDWEAVLQSGYDDLRGESAISKALGEAGARGMIDEDRFIADSQGMPISPALSTEAVHSPLTIGLIGQPNVGKSSLLNALFGTTKVKASRTPGKTKHFQTLFWTSEIRLVDCPGLVLPNYVPMELQALLSILPISQIPSLPSCVRYISSLLPLEEIFGLEHPSLKAPPVEDKRTWRGPRNPAPTPPTESDTVEKPGDTRMWTAMDIMQAYADKKGWVTAKAGRPDVNRAGNAILRDVAESRVRWTFWPPGYNPSMTRTHGLWITGPLENDDQPGEDDDEVESVSGDEGDDGLSVRGEDDSPVNNDTGSDESGSSVRAATSHFGILELDGDDESEGHDNFSNS